MSLRVGVDVSHYQTLADVTAAVRGGATYVIVKTSEGLGNDNPGDPAHPAHDAQVATARNLGVIVGHYHFAKSSGAAAPEAANFLRLAKAQPGDVLALDLESMDGSWPARARYAMTWLGIVAKATGATPIWYVNKSWLSALLPAQPSLNLYPLWIATAGVVAGTPGVTGWELHQYSTAGGIDHDVSAVDISQYAIPGDDVSAPTPAEFVALLKDPDVRLALVGAILGYKNTAINGDKDVYGLVTEAAQPVTPGAVDYDLLASKVADKLAERLAS